MTSGTMLLTSSQFEIGDLIETNGVQGIVTEINLNYTKIREFDGVTVLIPNSKVYGSMLVKFTHEKYKVFKPLKKEEFKKRKYYREYIKLLNKIISSNIKTTLYVKSIGISSSVNPENLDELLSQVFDQYEPVFGIRPSYAANTTLFGRLDLNLYVKSEKPLNILNYLDSFLRDLLYKLYPDEVYDGWDKYKKQYLIDSSKKGGES